MVLGKRCISDMVGGLVISQSFAISNMAKNLGPSEMFKIDISISVCYLLLVLGSKFWLT